MSCSAQGTPWVILHHVPIDKESFVPISHWRLPPLLHIAGLRHDPHRAILDPTSPRLPLDPCGSSMIAEEEGRGGSRGRQPPSCYYAPMPREVHPEYLGPSFFFRCEILIFSLYLIF